MSPLPASVLDGLSDKQLARLGLKRKKGGKGTSKMTQKAAAKATATPAKAARKTATKKASATPRYRLHTPTLLPDSVSVDLAKGTITLKLGGVPENWSNSRYGKAVYQKKHSSPWSKLVHSLADQARVQARMPRQEQKHERRRVEIMIFRCAPMFDPDGKYNAMKPVVDALKRVLIYDDNPTYLKLKVDQTQVFSKPEQRIRLIVRDLPLPT